MKCTCRWHRCGCSQAEVACTLCSRGRRRCQLPQRSRTRFGCRIQKSQLQVNPRNAAVDELISTTGMGRNAHLGSGSIRATHRGCRSQQNSLQAQQQHQSLQSTLERLVDHVDHTNAFDDMTL